jgi:hypothetical protein
MFELMRDVYEYVNDNTTTFELDDMIGPDLAYLLGAMMKGWPCQWPENRPLVRLLRARYGPGHEVWKFIDVEKSPAGGRGRARRPGGAVGDAEQPASAINNGEERTMTMPRNLTWQQLVDVVNHIRDILWLDVRGSREWLNPDKTWDAETLEMVAGVLEDVGLKPPATAENEG